MKQKYKRHNVYLLEAEWQRAKKIAFKKGITVSELIRTAMRAMYGK